MQEKDKSGQGGQLGQVTGGSAGVGKGLGEKEPNDEIGKQGGQGGVGGQPGSGGSGGQSDWDNKKGGSGTGSEAGRTGGAGNPQSGTDR